MVIIQHKNDNQKKEKKCACVRFDVFDFPSVSATNANCDPFYFG